MLKYEASSSRNPMALFGWIGLFIILAVLVLVVMDMLADSPPPDIMPPSRLVNAEIFPEISMGMNREEVMSILGTPHTEERGDRLAERTIRTSDPLPIRNALRVYKGYYGSHIKVLFDEKTHKLIALGGRFNYFGPNADNSSIEESPNGAVNVENFDRLRKGMSTQEVLDILGECHKNCWGRRSPSVAKGLPAGSYLRIGVVLNASMMPQEIDGLIESILSRSSERASVSLADASVPIDDVRRSIDDVCSSHDDIHKFWMHHEGRRDVSVFSHARNIFRGEDGKAIVVWFAKSDNKVVAKTFYDCDVETSLSFAGVPGTTGPNRYSFPWKRGQRGRNGLVQIPGHWFKLGQAFFVPMKIENAEKKHEAWPGNWVRPLGRKHYPFQKYYSSLLNVNEKDKKVIDAMSLKLNNPQGDHPNCPEYILQVASLVDGLHEVNELNESDCLRFQMSSNPVVQTQPEVLDIGGSCFVFSGSSSESERPEKKFGLKIEILLRESKVRKMLDAKLNTKNAARTSQNSKPLP